MTAKTPKISVKEANRNLFEISLLPGKTYGVFFQEGRACKNSIVKTLLAANQFYKQNTVKARYYTEAQNIPAVVYYGKEHFSPFQVGRLAADSPGFVYPPASLGEALGLNQVIEELFWYQGTLNCVECDSTVEKFSWAKYWPELETRLSTNEQGILVFAVPVASLELEKADLKLIEILEIFNLERVIIEGKIFSKDELDGIEQEALWSEQFLIFETIPLKNISKQKKAIEQKLNGLLGDSFDLLESYFFRSRKKEGIELGSIHKDYLCKSCKKVFDKSLLKSELANCLDQVKLLETPLAKWKTLSVFELETLFSKMENSFSAVHRLVFKRYCKTFQQLGLFGFADMQLSKSLNELSTGESFRLRLVSLFIQDLSGVLVVFDEVFDSLLFKEAKELISVFKKNLAANTVLLFTQKNELAELCSANFYIDKSLAVTSPEKVKLPPLLIAEEESSTELHTCKLQDEVAGKKSYQIALRGITVIGGRSGSGKSSLLNALAASLSTSFKLQKFNLEARQKLKSKKIFFSYAGLEHSLTELLANSYAARVAGLAQDDFIVLKSKHICSSCKALDVFTGVTQADESSLKPDCEFCYGMGFSPKLLGATFNEKNIYRILTASIGELYEFFSTEPEIGVQLELLLRLGFSSMPLSRRVSELDYSEVQRLKLYQALKGPWSNLDRPEKVKAKQIIFLDQVSSGLNHREQEQIYHLIKFLLSSGYTFIIADNGEFFAEQADKLIMLPGAHS